MSLSTFLKIAERALPVIVAAAAAVRDVSAAIQSDASTSSPPDAPKTKLHGPSGGQIAYGPDGRYLNNTLDTKSTEPTKH